MSAGTAVASRAGSLLPWSVFAALIASAGLPIYIHAPKFFADTYGVSMTALGLTLGVLRFIDVVQDPVLGWFAETLGRSRRYWVAGSALLMALAMFGLFAVPPLVSPLVWFALTLTALFTAFSFLTILFYAEGVAKAGQMGPTGHVRLAGWREGGSLVGVSLAAVAPTVLAMMTSDPYTAFAVGFCALALVAVVAMHREWRFLDERPRPASGVLSGFALFRPALSDAVTRRLLILAFLNAAPVAVTSTLFLLFVESRIGAPGAEGPYLLLFFLSAAASTVGWSGLAQRIGPKRTLMAGMILSIVAFLWAASLGTGAMIAFGVICVASGAALGADMTLLPAIFAQRLAAMGQGGEAAAFALWSFVSKLSLAVAAATLLPLLDHFCFVSGPVNTTSALTALTALYALLPCVLKLAAIGFLATVPVPEE